MNLLFRFTVESQQFLTLNVFKLLCGFSLLTGSTLTQQWHLECSRRQTHKVGIWGWFWSCLWSAVLSSLVAGSGRWQHSPALARGWDKVPTEARALGVLRQLHLIVGAVMTILKIDAGQILRGALERSQTRTGLLTRLRPPSGKGCCPPQPL